MNPPILNAKNLTKTFVQPSKYQIIKNASLKVHSGETIAIIGPSGSGKSTLLHILGTLDYPDSGTLEISGKNALTDTSNLIRNKYVGFVFQNYNLLDEYTVLENIIMPGKISRKTDLKDAIIDLFCLISCKEFYGTKESSFSRFVENYRNK